jgi:hypothetical protein
MKINQLKPGAYIELYATVVNVGPLRKLWKCYDCDSKSIWLSPSEFKDKCPKCNAMQSKEKRKGVVFQFTRSLLIEDDTGQTYLDVWNEQIDVFKPKDKIHLINGYAKKVEDTGYVHVQKGTYGKIEKC